MGPSVRHTRKSIKYAQECVAVDGVLMNARTKSAQFLAKRWISVKAEDGFAIIDKEILRIIADDISVPLRALTKPMDSAIFTLVSFKPRKYKQEDDFTSHIQEPEPPKIKRSLSDGTHCSFSDTESNVLYFT